MQTVECDAEVMFEEIRGSVTEKLDSARDLNLRALLACKALLRRAQGCTTTAQAFIRGLG